MTTSPIRAVLSHPVEMATTLLFLCTLVYIGTPSGAAFIMAIFGMAGAAAAVSEIHVWISGEREAVAEARRAAASNSDGKAELNFATFCAIVIIVLAQVFWYCAAFIPDPRFGGVLVTTPMAWFIANVMALPAALVAYRHSPRKLRTFLTAGTAAIVVTSLLISSIIPFMLAR